MKAKLGQSEGSIRSMLHLAGATLLAALLGVYFLGVYDQFLDQSDESESRVQLLTKELRDSNRIRTDHYRLQQDFESLEANVTEIRTRLERPLEQEQLSQALEQAAADASLQSCKTSIGKRHDASDHRRLELELECSGSYASICRFVDSLGRLPWLTDITQLSIEAKDHQSHYRLLAKFSVYYDRTSHDSDKS